MKQFILLLTICFFAISCKKEGVGGDASITGYVHVKKYNSTFTQYISEYPGRDIYVYIVYGEHSGFDKRVKTDYNGNFEFPYLYKGKYTLYAYSRDSTLQDPSGTIPVIREIQITERKQQEHIDTLMIFQ